MFKIFNKQETVKETKTVVKDIIPESKYLLTKEEVFVNNIKTFNNYPPLSERDTEIVKFINLIAENLDNLIIHDLNKIGLKVDKNIYYDAEVHFLEYNIIKDDEKYSYFYLSFKRFRDECHIWINRNKFNCNDIYSIYCKNDFTIDNYFNKFKDKFILDNHIYEFFVIFRNVFNINITYENGKLVAEKLYSENYDIFETY